MSTEPSKPPALWALLIGIARYLPNRLPNGQSYPSLEGPVRDVERMESFLLERLSVAPERIFKLTSSGSEPAAQLPSYKNIVAAWQHLSERVAPGEQVLICYSGHGGRVPTLVPELKGERGLDECLVPFDVGSAEARCLRDVELARLLAAMVEKGLFVTLVLDCCHAGGLTRGEGTAVRGLAVVDITPRPRDSLVASHAELVATWAKLAGTVRRSAPASGWLPTPRGYVLLAACQAHQTAFEVALDASGKSGALSYWLVHELERLSPRLTWRQVHQRLLAQVHGRFESQTPVIEGELDRVVFGSRRLEQPASVGVLRLDELRGRVLLDTGEAQGVALGDRFTIYPPEAELGGLEERIAEVELEQIGATGSWARSMRSLGRKNIMAGDRAVLVEPGALRLRRAVRLLAGSAGEAATLAAIEHRLRESGAGFLELAAAGSAADFQIAVDPRGGLEILDPTGCPLPGLGPLLAADPKTPTRLVERLVHLAKYLNVRQLHNPAAISPLRREIEVELLRLPHGYRDGRALETHAFDAAGQPTARAGEWVCLRVRNRSSMVVCVTVLDLQPDWGITQIHPMPDSFSSATREGWQILELPFEACLVGAARDGVDTLKVFITLDATDFRWLQLPSLDAPPLTQDTWRQNTPLAQLCALMATRLPPHRELEPSAQAALEWECAQVELRVVETRQ